VAIPVDAVADAVSVSVLELPAVEVGLKLAVTPDGKPLALSDTLLVKPFTRAMLIDLVPAVP
jgi:hypothetical protein